MPIDTYNSDDTWISPFDGDIVVRCRGNGCSGSGFDGGGSGSFASKTITVTLSTAYPLTISDDTGIGVPTFFDDGTLVSAPGASGTVGGVVGTGDFTAAGADGGVGDSINLSGGGGAAPAGPSGAGVPGDNGVLTTGGSGGVPLDSSSGTGGRGGDINTDGNGATAPGAGGGGAGGLLNNPGLGSAGRIEIEYELPATASIIQQLLDNSVEDSICGDMLPTTMGL